MRYLLDTDWIISFLNGKVAAVQLVQSLAADGIGISIISCGEVYEGLLSVSSPEERRGQFDAFTSRVEVIGLNLEVARWYGQIRSNLRASGLLIPDNDMWIASSARAHDAVLVSRDVHFARIPGLKIHEA